MTEKPKTDQQLRDELGSLLRDLGVQEYTKHLVETQIAAIKSRAVAINNELVSRQQARDALEAERAAEAAAAAEATSVEATPEEVPNVD
jgi:hypothetical protein